MKLGTHYQKMNKVSFIGLCLLTTIVSLAGPSFTAHAAVQEEGRSVTSLDLGFDTNTPGHEVLMALTLDVAEGVEVQTAISEVTFPNGLLSFEEVLSGLSAQAANAQVSAVVQVDDQNPENSIVTVTVSTEDGRFIPSGVIADLAFIISLEAPLEQTINLKNVVRALTTDDPPAPVDPIIGMEGEVQVTEFPPVFICFFFMH